MKFVKSVPLAIAGLSLALASIGNLFEQNNLPELRVICGILSGAVFVLLLLKLALHFPAASAELKTPMPLSVFPTSTMALMLLSVYVKDYINDNFAAVLWSVAVAAHLIIIFLFVKRFIVAFSSDTVFPTWFVPFVGIVVVSVTAPEMGARMFGQAVFYIGFILYFVALALILWRMKKPKAFPEPARPTIAIFTAPMSLCLAGYFESFLADQRSAALIYIMLAIAVIFYIYVSIMMVSLLKIKFYPTYAAFTFPYVISAIAFRAGNYFLISQGYNFFAPVMYISFWIAFAVVLYVLVRYIMYFVLQLKT